MVLVNSNWLIHSGFCFRKTNLYAEQYHSVLSGLHLLLLMCIFLCQDISFLCFLLLHWCWFSYCLDWIACTFYSAIGAVYLIYHLVLQESIIWSNFNLQNGGGELLQAGLGLFLLQVVCLFPGQTHVHTNKCPILDYPSWFKGKRSRQSTCY